MLVKNNSLNTQDFFAIPAKFYIGKEYSSDQ